jgi:hypothetical protein
MEISEGQERAESSRDVIDSSLSSSWHVCLPFTPSVAGIPNRIRSLAENRGSSTVTPSVYPARVFVSRASMRLKQIKHVLTRTGKAGSAERSRRASSKITLEGRISPANREPSTGSSAFSQCASSRMVRTSMLGWCSRVGHWLPASSRFMSPKKQRRKLQNAGYGQDHSFHLGSGGEINRHDGWRHRVRPSRPSRPRRLPRLRNVISPAGSRRP